MARKKSSEETEAWDEWGEKLGKRIEARFASPPRGRGQGFSVWAIVVSLFFLCWGIVWMGNDLGWWSTQFPFWPMVIIMLSLAVFLSAVKHRFKW